MDVSAQGNGTFFFKFALGEGKGKVLEGGPWLFAGRHVFLRKWARGINLADQGVSKIPVWIQLYNIPVELWTTEGLSYLASVVGEPLYADLATESKRRLSFAPLSRW